MHDSWGDSVDGVRKGVKTEGECCAACQKTLNCNIWVWCGDPALCGSELNDCWLKHLAYQTIVPPKDMGPDVGWTTGTMIDLQEIMEAWKNKKKAEMKKEREGSKGTKKYSYEASMEARESPLDRKDVFLPRLKEGVKEPQMFHTVTSGAGLYNQWQTRVHYYHFLKMKAECKRQQAADGSLLCEMGGFTRLLHSGEPDNIMDEMPTVVVNLMPNSIINHDDYPVLNRPYAFVEWMKVAKIPEKYVLMAEPDHIFLRPIPNFMKGDRPAAFNFGYMNPASQECRGVVMRLLNMTTVSQVEEVGPIGNSPTFLTVEDMKRVMPIWMDLSITVYKDVEAKKVWGWVQEMYAFTMAMWKAGIKEVDLIPHMVAQPPWDSDYELMPGRPFYINHYTYGLDFNTSTGKVLMDKVGDWHFDKRDYSGYPIPRGLRGPPDHIDFDLGHQLIEAFNEATQSIPCWNVYASSTGSNSTKTCGEKSSPFYHP